MKLEILQNGSVVESRDLSDGTYKLGRSPDCDIVLKSPRISKQHALLVVKNGKAAIVDMGSANGIFINGILIRKQRVGKNDDIVIADYHLRVGGSGRGSSSRPAPEPAMGPVAGNVAYDMSAQPFAEPQLGAAAVPAPAPQLTAQEKLLLLVDEKVLSPLYGLMKTLDWRMLLFSVLAGGLLLAVLATVVSVLPWGQGIATDEALKRAHAVLGQVVRENYRMMAKGNDITRLSVEAAESEPGILSVSIVDPKANTVLAPQKLLNKAVTSIHYLLAIEKIKTEKKDRTEVPRGDSRYVVAQPIYVYSQENADRELIGIVLADFEIPKGIQAVYEPLVRAVLFGALLLLAAFYIILKMVTYPIVNLTDQLDSALKGETNTINCDIKFSEIESLSSAINFSVSKWKQASGQGELKADDSEKEAAQYQTVIQEFDAGTSDCILLLDRDKKIVFVGKIAEEVLGIRNQYAQGQNITEAARDQSFAGTVIDLCENVIQSLGETQSAQLEVNGVSRTIVAVGHKDSQGSITHVLVTVKMNGSA